MKLLAYKLYAIYNLVTPSLALTLGTNDEIGGLGIFKTTIAASAPETTTLPWLLEYMPVYSSSNSCGGQICDCGETGRTEMNNTEGFCHEDQFGLHTVLAAGINGTREAASGTLSLADIEDIFGQEIGDLSSYSGFLDYHTAVWASSLDSFADKFTAGGVPFLLRRFTDADETYFSLTAHARGSQLVLELISDTATEPAGGWVDTTDTRHFFQGRAPPTVEDGYLYPLHASRAADGPDAIIAFYSAVFAVTPNVDETMSDGTRFLVYGGSGSIDDLFSPDVSLQFVFRQPSENGGASAVAHTTQWFQQYLVDTNMKYMTSYLSCWPIWGDDHIAVSFPTTSMDVFVNRLDAVGGMYHSFKGNTTSGGCGFPPNSLYMVDPSGWTVQAVGVWPDDPTFLPGSDIDDGGFGGYCYDFCVDDV